MKIIDDLINWLDDSMKALNASMDASHEQWKQENPEQAACDHGVVFDKDAAADLFDEAPTYPNLDPSIGFVMGHSAHLEVRKRWPRLNGPCPKGCGYHGIAYASSEHYVYGDW